VASDDELRWDPPGPGEWTWDGAHLPNVPTPIYRAVHQQTLSTSIARMFERYGVPLGTIREEFVNGRGYSQLTPLVGKPGAAPPPKPVLWLATRLHPAFRRRAKAAAHALEHKVWRERTAEWRSTLRPRLREENLALQREVLGALDDAALADHLRRAHDHVVAGHLLHFDLHGDDLGPLGMYLASCRDWGLDPGDAIAALSGHSPSTAAPVEALGEVASAMRAAGWAPAAGNPADLDALRALGPEVDAAVDRYLEEFGWRVVTGYDVDSKTVGELPAALVANVLANLEPFDWGAAAESGDARAAELRARVPPAERGHFDEVLGEARLALDMRDDNGPITVEWPMGLLRRALLEAGHRLVERSALRDPEHAVELSLDEVTALVTGGAGPSAEETAARAQARRDASAVVPPDRLGEPSPPPDLSAFPPPLARTIDMAMTATSLLGRGEATARSGAAAHGLGVGTEPYIGRARVAHRADEALALLEPGEVLVVPFTTPAYNAVLAVCGAVVTEEGGVLAHAAVLARELGLPAVIGAHGALAAIPDGATVEVDPGKGTVTLV
jgi:pyruvate,water dikinase